MDVPAVPPAHQHIRAAHRICRVAAVPGQGVDADTFVLAVPMKEQQPMLALIVSSGASRLPPG